WCTTLTTPVPRRSSLLACTSSRKASPSHHQPPDLVVVGRAKRSVPTQTLFKSDGPLRGHASLSPPVQTGDIGNTCAGTWVTHSGWQQPFGGPHAQAGDGHHVAASRVRGVGRSRRCQRE